MEHNNNLKKEYDRTIQQLETAKPGTEQYNALLATLGKISELQKKEWIVSPSDVLNASTSLLGILLVLNYERVGIVTSRAFGMIRRS